MRRRVMKNQRNWSCLLAVLIILTSASCKPQRSADAKVAKIIEAENCGQEEGCRLEGFWESWAMPEFSDGQLVNNEETQGKPASFSELSLNFQGTRVIIVYRQDVWYGSLRVEIDGKAHIINQRGAIKNQAEACFEVDGEDSHTLVLTGSEDTGVITLDAIKVLEDEGHCSDKESSPNHSVVIPANRGLVVPAYIYPDLPNGYWSQLVAASKKIGESLVVIANVDNGPGVEKDLRYNEAIRAVVSSGGNAIGYVHTCYADSEPIHSLCPRTEHSITADIDRWYDFYGDAGLSAIFFDEVSSRPEKVSFYRELYNYVQDKQPGATVIFNFGAEPHQSFLDIGSSILCIFENEYSFFVGWTPPSWITSERLCALVHNTPAQEFESALDHLTTVGWFYLTSDIVPNPWDTLPPYFPDLVNLVSD